MWVLTVRIFYHKNKHIFFLFQIIIICHNTSLPYIQYNFRLSYVPAFGNHLKQGLACSDLASQQYLKDRSCLGVFRMARHSWQSWGMGLAVLSLAAALIKGLGFGDWGVEG